MSQFKVGDVVELNSGGPRMTVTKAGAQSLAHGPVGPPMQDDEVETQWFRYEHSNFLDVHTGRFNHACLKKYEKR
jgi:uncharacterized protein YodC (DUF2158 family)